MRETMKTKPVIGMDKKDLDKIEALMNYYASWIIGAIIVMTILETAGLALIVYYK